MNVLRLATAGNVDDGKSTLIGRLLVDSRGVHEDQIAAARLSSARRGHDGLDLAMLTDGLRAERDQGITIDVAYRYFATSRRKFVIADCPGHFQYTRNMITGVSIADAAVILIDATKDLQEQTRRHCFIASLLRVPHLVACVNKMDLVGYAERTFLSVRVRIEDLARELGVENLAVIPISALAGDNVVEPSTRMPWYRGRCLLEHLEGVEPPCSTQPAPLRFAVQGVILPAGGGSRGYTGILSCGSIQEGDEALVLPGGARTRVASVGLGGRAQPRAQSPVSLTVHLREELDVARGDMLACPAAPPRVAAEFDAQIFWMSDAPLAPGRKLSIRHTTAETPASVLSVDHKLGLDAACRAAAEGQVGLNEFAGVRLRAGRPLCHDAYRDNRVTGSFILIDDATNATVAAGMIL
ncbi:MAG: 50S ribosome-binding GTPase [Elusimicrobia bacterium]|nr:50S ribosome-binding GTPase [Elusimicrobiota bacterium]